MGVFNKKFNRKHSSGLELKTVNSFYKANFGLLFVGEEKFKKDGKQSRSISLTESWFEIFIDN